ncbi:MAG: hypothetical protein WC732_07450 [Candidatus Omnitrophota bacterium]
MKKLSLVVFLVLSVFSMATMMFAQDEAALAQEAAGTVVSVDAQGQKLVVSCGTGSEAKEMALIADDATTVEKDGVTVTLAEVAAGDAVTATYRVDDQGRNVATAIVTTAVQE